MTRLSGFDAVLNESQIQNEDNNALIHIRWQPFIEAESERGWADAEELAMWLAERSCDCPCDYCQRYLAEPEGREQSGLNFWAEI